MLPYIELMIGCIVTAFAASTFRGLTVYTYSAYVLSQVIAVMLFLLANEKMSPIHYVVGVNAGITIAACVIIWARGMHISIYAITGCMLMVIGTYLTTQ